MCGRYTITTAAGKLEERFEAQLAFAYEPRFNAAPSQELPVILNRDASRIVASRWGVLPPWAKHPLINARAETAATKPVFKDAFLSRRCLVLADGFFEWDSSSRPRQPYRFTLSSREPFALAGIWQRADLSARGHADTTFSILTTAANTLVASVHDRMPVILSREAELPWLEGSLKEFLVPYPVERMSRFAVSTRVNSPRNDSPDLLLAC